MYLTGSTDRTAKLWDLDRGELLTDFTHHHQSILTVSASMAGAPDELFFLASHDRTASAVSPVTGEVWFPWACANTHQWGSDLQLIAAIMPHPPLIFSLFDV